MRGRAPGPDLSRRVAGGAFSTLGATLVSRALAMVQSIAVARLLDPHRVGLFAVVSYALSVAGTLCDLGLPVAVTKLIAEDRATRPWAVLGVAGRLARVVLAISLVVAGALFLGADGLSRLYHAPALGFLFRLGAVALVFSVAGGFRSAVLQGVQRIHLLAGLSTLGTAAMLVLTLLLTPTLGLPGIILAAILAEGVVWLGAARPLWRVLAEARGAPGAGDRVAPTAPLLPRAFHIAAPSFLTALSLFGAAWFVRSYLGGALGYEAVGLYQIGDATARVLMLVSGAIAVPLVPVIAELHATGRGFDGVDTILRCTLFVTLPGAIFLALGGRPLLALVFGRAYAGAGGVIGWLALAAVFQAAANVCWSAQVGAGRIWVGFAITAVGQALLVGGALALTPRWGLGGLGASVAAAQALTFGLAARDVGARLHVSFRGVGPLLPVALCGWAGVAGLFWMGAEGLLSGLALVAGVVLWQALLLRPSEWSLAWKLGGLLALRGAPRG